MSHAYQIHLKNNNGDKPLLQNHLTERLDLMKNLNNKIQILENTIKENIETIDKLKVSLNEFLQKDELNELLDEKLSKEDFNVQIEGVFNSLESYILTTTPRIKDDLIKDLENKISILEERINYIEKSNIHKKLTKINLIENEKNKM